MKEITRIHLAKTPYSIELDAKKELEAYVAAIEKSMHAEEEVLREIESRMVELLAERGVLADQVISSRDVESIRQQLGEPREFSDEDEAEVIEKTETLVEKPAKRFMRDVDNGVFGGVCSGLAAYFNKDVTLIRLLTVAAIILSAGSLLLAYILFWIITPAARTAADKLEMSGKPVTLEALRDSSDTSSSRPSRTLVNVLRYVLGGLIAIAAAGAAVGVMVGGFVGYDIAQWLDGFSAQPWVFGMLISLFVGGLALILLLSLLAYAVFAKKVTRPVGIGILATIAVGVISISTLSISAIQARAAIDKDQVNLVKTAQIQLPNDLSGVESLQVIGGNMHDNYGYGYYGYQIDSTGWSDLRAELKYWDIKQAPKPEVKVSKDGKVLTFEISNSAQQVVCPAAMTSAGYGCAGFEPTVELYRR